MLGLIYFRFYYYLEICFDNAEEKLSINIWESQIADQCVINEKIRADENIIHKLDVNYQKFVFIMKSSISLQHQNSNSNFVNTSFFFSKKVKCIKYKNRKVL